MELATLFTFFISLMYIGNAVIRGESASEYLVSIGPYIWSFWIWSTVASVILSIILGIRYAIKDDSLSVQLHIFNILSSPILFLVGYPAITLWIKGAEKNFSDPLMYLIPSALTLLYIYAVNCTMAAARQVRVDFAAKNLAEKKK